jgi:hypothetical protein
VPPAANWTSWLHSDVTVAVPVIATPGLETVLPRTMIRPAKSSVPWISRSPSMIHTPDPSTVPAPFTMTEPWL